MIEADGVFRYEVPTDVAALVETAVWVRARRARMVVAWAIVWPLMLVLGLLTRSFTVIAIAMAIFVEIPILIWISTRRIKRHIAEQFGTSWRVGFGQGGVVVDRVQASTSIAWSFFGAWTLHHGQLVLVHGGAAVQFIALPIAVVPEDEWQRLTTLLYENLGPALKPDSVRGSRLRTASRVAGSTA